MFGTFYKRINYNTQKDVKLLELILAHNPFEQWARWKIVQKQFNQIFRQPHSARSIRNRLENIIKAHEKGETKRDATSHEQFREKVRLTKEVIRLIEVYAEIKHGPALTEIKRGFDINEIKTSEEDLNSIQFMFLEESSDELSEQQQFTANRELKIETDPTESNAIEFLTVKTTPNTQMRKRRLELEKTKLRLREKKFKLEQEKFELEKEEMERKLDMELKEKKMHMRVLEQQQTLIAMLIQKHQTK
ncbi:uncharacterized protein LOC132706763 [Cylas formicarius]|uniref:uncharacterized protein LOC132706763 n=1 Tax=Cylas formicarius TaxID=197179 RepID=UPI002958686B|nr:uncharacterized protein LOC132706763 [Cylas formicarius]